ncbi:MAG: DUF5721 family protein [Lachnospiraceae bacterium]|nr:DUF5721 family protein [Lachnospiraceae bacterium]
MVTLRITDVKKCMNELLCKDTFDFFLLQEATINTYASFSIDGHRLDDYYSKEELEAMDDEDVLLSYEMFRNHFFEIIKGKKVPLSFKIILSLPKRIVAQLINASELNYQAKDANLVAIFKYSEGELTVTSGVGFSEFIMDKSLEKEFDKWLQNFLNAAGIDNDKIT